MPRFTVLDDTRRHPDLAEQIAAILYKVAPLVEEKTCLSVPSEVRFRLLTPKAWRKAEGEYRQHILARDIADPELSLSPEQIAPIRLGLKITKFMPVLVWPLVLGSTVVAADGRSETLLVPRALRHCGLLAHEPSLHQVVSHELTHHAQDAACGDNAAWKTFFPQLRKVAPGSISPFVEGHASWTDQQVTTLLYGAPVNHTRQARRSLRARLHKRIPGIRRLGPSAAAYQQGARFVDHTVTTQGVELINRVWKDTALLPSMSELAEPDTWIARTGV
ncbi:zinc-dependent metalloprotease [Streptomyces olivaceus]|uniref:zinc-dependent metalloprotease n=1 Tax=Streptomyces olivaceus TaxID=47716 RepID=UPI001CC9190D|nr:zinc-dependent metalloprotease [Streptomyces olivaceus]MBZ6253598.1 zinc-dependent metalloprotease [Streptomyces olivaceus]